MESFPRKWNPHFLSAPITCMWCNFYLCGNESRTLPHRKVFPWEWKHVTQTSPRENGLQILTLSLFKIQNARVALSVAILCERRKTKWDLCPYLSALFMNKSVTEIKVKFVGICFFANDVVVTS